MNAGFVTLPDSPSSVAVVGAGIAGLTAARHLIQRGFRVCVFEKSRGPGGRMATRRHDDLQFDHGAQYFTSRTPEYRRCVDQWVEAGVVARWRPRLGLASGGRIVEKEDDGISRYVGMPRMSALTRHLAAGLDIRYQTRVGALDRMQAGWIVRDADGLQLGEYAAVILTTPPRQVVPLLASLPHLAAHADAVRMSPCWAVMAAFGDRLEVNCDGLFFANGPLSWAARNSSKPGRAPEETWVLHASPEWSRDNIENDRDVVSERLLLAFFEGAGISTASPSHVQAHRWRYALAETPLQSGCLWDGEAHIGAAGDWCNGSRVEGAWRSGLAVAGLVTH